ncbi:sensor histidine kinase [Streptomyces sp. NPDC057280]|uniref:sensor histidine kinase n=1 Tax=Streptomyces sp. NPDC057280 TaxID=3346081 RepID=UPI0036255713
MVNVPAATVRPHEKLRERRGLVGAVAMLISVAVSVPAAPGVWGKAIVGVLGAVAVAGTLLGQRASSARHAVGGLSLTIVTGFAITALAPAGLGEVPILFGVAFLPTRMAPGPVRTAVMAAVATGFGVLIMVITRSAAGLLAGVAAWILADRFIEHAALEAERNRAMALLAEVEASREAQREAAALEERARIVREMHDVLAHSLAALSMQLQALRAVAAREGVGESLMGPLDRAADLARDGVQEVRAAVGALRGGPLRGVDDLAALAERYPGSVRMRVVGQKGEVSAKAGHAVYRAVQEALTNAARYATGSRVDVNLAWEPDELRLAVRDYGLPPGGVAAGARGSGTGLRGMGERVEAVGGSLSTGPAPEGPGWRVVLRVPVAAPTGGGSSELGAGAGGGGAGETMVDGLGTGGVLGRMGKESK